DLLHTAKEVKRICVIFNATFILNDNAEIAKAVNADGVHLGKDDMPIKQARRLLGDHVIIGTSCNTFNDIAVAAKEPINYTGLGPYRYTATRKNLNPLLGLDGIRDAMRQYHIQGYKLPVVAIGGVRLEDLPFLLQAGVHGVAVSSAVHNSEKRAETVKEFIAQVQASNVQHVA
ncbi:MAG TPA: thiamine phosphate synthase, partial [Chitinophagales bacterium]|nr:thiamine phosphate synthase [Chitinophagales bacterium]